MKTNIFINGSRCAKALSWVCVVACGCALASCSTVTQTARTTTTSVRTSSEAIADLKVGERITETMYVTASIRRGGMNNIRHAVEKQALEKAGNADVLLNPEYVIYTRRGLFGSKVKKITVTGRPATYQNFRSKKGE